MASGVAVDDEVLTAYEDIKLRHKYKYIILGMKDNDKKIGILKLADTTATYEEFCDELMAAEKDGDCRYAILDFDYKIERSGGAISEQNKLLFYVWCPDKSKIKRKMLYSSSKDALKKKLQGIHAEIQCTDHSEITHNYVLEKVRDRERT